MFCHSACGCNNISLGISHLISHLKTNIGYHGSMVLKANGDVTPLFELNIITHEWSVDQKGNGPDTQANTCSVFTHGRGRSSHLATD